MGRIAIYYLYGQRGEVARYKIYYLSQLTQFADRLVIICNGEMTGGGCAALKQFTDDVIVCEKERNDFWTYKKGLEYIGWDALVEYDECLLCNDTFFGPIFPLHTVFSEMGKKDCDFWGIFPAAYAENMSSAGERAFPEGYGEETAADAFINFNSRILRSDAFKQYWNGFTDASDPSKSLRIIHHLQKCGFKWEHWGEDGIKRNRFRNAPYELLKNHRHPLVMKESVNGSISLRELCTFGYGDEAYKSLEYIEQYTGYDVGMIFEDILQNNHLSVIQERLQLEYIIPENYLERDYTYKKKIAVICHIFYSDLVGECASYSENFPEGTDFYLTTTSEETLEKIHSEYGKRRFHYQVQIIPNQGFDTPALFVTYSNVITSDAYEYVCFFHDKKSVLDQHEEIGKQFKRRCYNALFGTKNIVLNIINKFEEHPYLGIIATPPPYHNYLFNCEFRSWKSNYNKIEEMAKRVGIDVPLNREKWEPSALGAMFWCRAKALKKILTQKLTYDDFAEAIPGKRDGTISHAIERIYGLAAQDSGYYLAYAISSEQARNDLVNYQAMLFGREGIVPMISKCIPWYANYHEFMDAVKTRLAQTPVSPISTQELLDTIPTSLLVIKTVKRIVKRIIPGFIWRRLARKRRLARVRGN